MRYESFLSRLDKVRRTGNHKWLACCPAHPDDSPSLSIAVDPEGKLLAHCFAGCPTADIMAAVGMTLGDMFPDEPNWKRDRDENMAWALNHERQVLAIARGMKSRGEKIDPASLPRIELAARRVKAIQKAMGAK